MHQYCLEKWRMKLLKVPVKKIRKIKKDIYLLSFTSYYLAKKSLPGQFLHIKVDSSTILRRPFSVHRVAGNDIFVLFKIRGKGTHLLSQYRKGDFLDIIGPLGNKFNYHFIASPRQLPNEYKRLRILMAGGIGVAPLVFLGEKVKRSPVTGHPLKSLSSHGASKSQVLVLLGAKTKRDILCKEDFKKLGYKVLVATEDGSIGFKGTVIELLKKTLSTMDWGLSTKIYACGPKEMFLKLTRVLRNYPEVECEISFDQFMGCGVGICYACTIDTLDGPKRVCRDGPVFNLRKIRVNSLGS